MKRGEAPAPAKLATAESMAVPAGYTPRMKQLYNDVVRQKKRVVARAQLFCRAHKAHESHRVGRRRRRRRRRLHKRPRGFGGLDVVQAKERKGQLEVKRGHPRPCLFVRNEFFKSLVSVAVPRLVLATL